MPEVFFSPDQLLAQKAAPRGHLTSPRPRLTGQRALTTTATSGLACALSSRGPLEVHVVFVYISQYYNCRCLTI